MKRQLWVFSIFTWVFFQEWAAKERQLKDTLLSAEAMNAVVMNDFK